MRRIAIVIAIVTGSPFFVSIITAIQCKKAGDFKLRLALLLLLQIPSNSLTNGENIFKIRVPFLVEKVKTNFLCVET